MVFQDQRKPIRKRQLRSVPLVTRFGVAGLTLVFPVIGAFAQPKVAPAYDGKLRIELAGDLGSGVQPTQMVFGPDNRLYVMSNSGNVYSLRYNPATGVLSDKKTAAFVNSGIGIAFHTGKTGKTALYVTVQDEGNFFGNNFNHDHLLKLTDDNRNGVWGESDETRVRIVANIPTGDHNADQILVRGDSLYVSIGIRTINGRQGQLTSGSTDDFNGKGFWLGGNGVMFGDSALGGTICMIEDLNQVADVEDAANPYGSSAIRNQAFYQDNAAPYSATLGAGKLRVHSAGARNPFGLAFDKDGALYFTNNFNRVETNGDGTAGFGYLFDSLDNADLTRDVYDQVFKAKKGGDYGYSNVNWRSRSDAPILNPSSQGYSRVLSLTYDNLFNKGPFFLHDPANPDGMGPSASADGCSFFYASNLPAELVGNLFVTRYSGPISDGKGKRLEYQDVVAVDVASGKVRRVAQSFASPLCALSDNAQRLLVGEYGSGKIWAIRPAVSRVSAVASLTRSDTIRAAIRLSNSGDIALKSVAITGAKLNVAGTTTSLPLSIGTLAVGASVDRNLSFPLSAATPGQTSILTLTVRYDGGTFSLSQRIVAP